MEIFQIAKKTLFPNGYLAPPPMDPTPEEQVILRDRVATRIQEVIPGKSSTTLLMTVLPLQKPVETTNDLLSGWLSPLVLGAHTPAREQTIDDILDPLSSAECNTHLVMFLMDSVLMTLIPEMGTTTDASMIDGPPSAVPTRSRIIQPGAGVLPVSSRESSGGENGNGGSERGRNPSPGQSSATTGVYVHM